MKPVKLINSLITLFFIAVIYILLSFFFFNYIDSKSHEVLATRYLENGITLDEISQNNVLNSVSDSKSTLAQNLNIVTLNGGTGIKTSDPKVLAMKKFLQNYNSPMVSYADIFVNEAEKLGLDWRLVASISGVESAFGNLIPNGTNNGWGWRGGPGGAYSIFPTWKEGIVTVTRGLANGYGVNLTPFQIERAYCPPCYANPYHAWANGVTNFMNELDYYYINLDKL